MSFTTVERLRGAALLAVAALPLCSAPRDANAFAFVFAGESVGLNVVAHPTGYTGLGGVINVTVGIDPTSAHAAQMVSSVQAAVNTWNALVPTNGNLQGGIPAGQYDFQSTVLHELGHALGLDHPNLGNPSNYTKSGDGPNNTIDTAPGADGIPGSADDIRGDDQNLNYFRIANNDPFTIAPVVDSTTYSRNLANLPAGHSYSANADRTVGAALGYANSEAVMQQGQPIGEVQRQLGFDDVAGLRYAMSGLDEIAGTADDYIVNLIFLGIEATAQILLDFDSSKTTFAETVLAGNFIGATDHVRISSARIYFSDTVAWFFGETAIPVPASLTLFGAGLLGIALRRKRAAA